jgi:hypothetical protein
MKIVGSHKDNLQLTPQTTVEPLMDPISPTGSIVVINSDVKYVITWDIPQRPAPNSIPTLLR